MQVGKKTRNICCGKKQLKNHCFQQQRDTVPSAPICISFWPSSIHRALGRTAAAHVPETGKRSTCQVSSTLKISRCDAAAYCAQVQQRTYKHRDLPNLLAGPSMQKPRVQNPPKTCSPILPPSHPTTCRTEAAAGEPAWVRSTHIACAFARATRTHTQAADIRAAAATEAPRVALGPPCGMLPWVIAIITARSSCPTLGLASLCPPATFLSILPWVIAGISVHGSCPTFGLAQASGRK